MGSEYKKQSYTIPCASAFRDKVSELAARRRVNVGDLARSVLLMVPRETIDDFTDPGEPAHDDRETVILKSGTAKGRPWRRKPRLQVRMTPGYEIPFMRKALGLAIALAEGAQALELKINGVETAPDSQGPQSIGEMPPVASNDPVPDAESVEELARLKTIVSVLSFEPLDHGVETREDALYVLGFPPGKRPQRQELRARFRMLATIHHPDSHYGDHRRMSQLNTAMDILRSSAA